MLSIVLAKIGGYKMDDEMGLLNESKSIDYRTEYE